LITKFIKEQKNQKKLLNNLFEKDSPRIKSQLKVAATVRCGKLKSSKRQLSSCLITTSEKSVSRRHDERPLWRIMHSWRTVRRPQRIPKYNLWAASSGRNAAFLICSSRMNSQLSH
jgi:hypothetical protein